MVVNPAVFADNCCPNFAVPLIVIDPLKDALLVVTVSEPLAGDASCVDVSFILAKK